MTTHIHVHVGGKVKDAGTELDKFVAQVKQANEHLTAASRAVEALSSLKDSGLKSQAAELERKIDAARSYAFKIR